MEVKVVMPRLGEEMTRGTIIEWFKKEGDQVSRGEALFLVDTEKAALEVEATVAGVLKKILASEDKEKQIPVGETIALIETES